MTNPSDMPQVPGKLTRRALLAGTGAAAVAAGAVLLPPGSTTMATAAPRNRELVLVRDGEPQSVIVVEEPDSQFVFEAAQELREHVAKASGAELDIVGPDEPQRERVAIHIGRGRLATALMRAHGIELEPEQYWIKTIGNKILIVGHDIEYETPADKVNRSPATIWGVNYLLDRYLGVRWLWPGEAGTYIPTQETIAIPEIDLVDGPSMVMRQLRTHLHLRMGNLENLLTEDEFETVRSEATQWRERHQMGQRLDITSGHSFRAWWAKYSDTNPDYFAQPIPGYEQPWPNSNTLKLRLGNPAVVDQVVDEWLEAGAPDYWSVAPNDGSRGFCTHETTRNLDIPADLDPEDIWLGRVSLTTRYVRFWNSLLDKMRAVNPKVRILTYAYSNYRDAPPPDVTLNEGAIVGMVHSYWHYDQWPRWSTGGAELFLRPNWWYSGADAPHIPIRDMGEYFQYARDHDMRGFDFDSLHGYWGVQAINYYLVGRLSSRPDLTIDDVVDEFASAFGPAAQAVRDYLGYWEQITREAAYPIGSGGVVSQDPDGRYETLAREHDLDLNPQRGSYEILPHLYTDEVLAPTYAILDDADDLARDDDAAKARIAFLRDGLRQLEQAREVLRLGYGDPTSPEYLAEAEKLLTLRKDLTLRHVVWGEHQYRAEFVRGIPTYPAAWI